MFTRRQRGAISHVITFLDDIAVCPPTLDAWDQFVWLLSAAIPWAAREVEQYGYHHGNTVNLGPVMPAVEFRVTDDEGAYLCMAWALIFKGSILVYNPTRDEAEWVPTHSVANDLSWAEERMAVTLVNFVPHVPQEAECIVELGIHHLLCLPDSSSLEEEDEQMQEEDDGSERDEHKEAEGQEEEDPPKLEELGEMGLGAEPQR